MQQYHADNNVLIERIVMGDKKGISNIAQSVQWCHIGSLVKIKFKLTVSVQKVMWMVYWDRKSILLIDLLPSGETVSTDHYCETMQKHQHAIKNKKGCAALSSSFPYWFPSFLSPQGICLPASFLTMTKS